MKHRYSMDGWCYRLRPVRISDAQFIIDVRLEDLQRNRFIHRISDNIEQQKQWLEQYFQREGDYYFVVENRFTAVPEGLIAFYNVIDGSAEWGRWVLKKGSLAAVESVYLLYRIAFEQAGLQELYCCTVAENTSVVSFHTSIGEKTREIRKNAFEIDGKRYDAVVQYADRAHFYEKIAPVLEKQGQIIAGRIRKRIGLGMEFHHIGIATQGIEKELPLYTLMEYKPESNIFEDPAQGVRGLFLAAEGQPRLELLENLPGSTTLDIPLKNGQKMYHTAYFVRDIEMALQVLKNQRGRILSPLKDSVFFGTRICFVMLPNMSLIELIEKT